MEIVFIVDDNLIGNKKAVTPLLETLGAWQEANGFPFIFVTEASLDLAEDDALMRLMINANILSVFIGIESPNEASLVETKKHQNVTARRTIVDRVRAVQKAGLEVWSGMIVGFDHDDETIFSAQREFPARGTHRAGDGRHAVRDPEDSAARAAHRRGPARSR